MNQPYSERYEKNGLKLVRILKNGGSTIAKNGKEVNDLWGYAVGGFTSEVVMMDIAVLEYMAKHGHFKGLGKIYSSFVTVFKSIIKATGGQATHIGFWIDKGKLYIDATKQIVNYNDAIAEATKRKQLSIWDFANERLIWRTGEGKNDWNIKRKGE